VIGKGMAESNPAKALEIFQELFKACPDATDRTIWTRYPNGSSGGGGVIEGVQPFIDGLVAADPQAAMDAASQGGDAATLARGMETHAVASVARSWVRQDLEGFGGWVESQEPGPLQDHGAVILTNDLASRGEYSRALDWSTRMSDQNMRRSSAQNAFQLWQSSDPGAAAEWLRQTALPEDLQKALEPYRSER
jgi:hypothetical protein